MESLKVEIARINPLANTSSDLLQNNHKLFSKYLQHAECAEDSDAIAHYKSKISEIETELKNREYAIS